MNGYVTGTLSEKVSPVTCAYAATFAGSIFTPWVRTTRVGSVEGRGMNGRAPTAAITMF
ncbi:Uncharacterised protein [Mycobacteroides abscessus]|nr:Uncharacterised protein [Mycobacteroides abscessus]SHT61094.1 Uncharacterised protein [Mycobacteroides abscessus subsp. abscessus]SKV40156.1 Uncharacterised protein [Mycobacteroides abscessus subsp. abscessus]SKY33053.1 Uncharacterised protein [Mycobacteroides abscessus subsp. abscessus]